MNLCKALTVVILPLFLLGCEPSQTSSAQTPAGTTPATEQTEVPPAASAKASAVVPANSSNCILRLGYEAWEPYQFTNLDNKADGLDVEVLQAVAERMQCQLQPQQGSWTELVAALKAGELDMLPGASQTEARREFAHFSQPYRTEQFQLFIRSADSASYPQTSLSDFMAAGHKVGIISDYFYGNEFAELSAREEMKANFIEASLGELNVARLLDEDIDAMLEDAFVGRSMLRRKGLAEQIGTHSITLGSSDVYVMFSKASVSPEQVEAFNQALAALKQDGSYAAIIARYQQ